MYSGVKLKKILGKIENGKKIKKLKVSGSIWKKKKENKISFSEKMCFTKNKTSKNIYKPKNNIIFVIFFPFPRHDHTYHALSFFFSPTLA